MRSKYKLPFIGKTLHNYIYKNGNIKVLFFTKNKSINLIQFLLNIDFYVYNGYNFYNLKLNAQCINKKLGEFLFTRKFFKFKKKKKK
jgi:ribosomal protein S19